MVKVSKYVLVIHEDSLMNESVFEVHSEQPFSGISVGVYLSHQIDAAWINPPKGNNEKFVISEIEQSFPYDSNFKTQQTNIVVKKVAYKF
ncbi:hypothetical protein AAFX60_017250 [Aliivibrio fischeri]